MSAERLRDELRSLPGVADAEIDQQGDVPANVRVRLHPEADPDRVGVEVQRILASYGMRSRVAGDEGADAAVVSLPAPESPAPPRPEAPPPVMEVPPRATPATASDAPIDEAAAEETPQDAEVATPRPESPAPTSDGSRLASVSVEESADAAVVVATAGDGRRFSQRTSATEEAVTTAVVAVVGALVQGRPPRLLSVSAEVTEGTEALTVVLERADGSRAAGAAVVAAGRAYAVARATWAALDS